MAKAQSRRINPYERGAQSPTSCDHLARYLWACKRAEGKCVLDVGSGSSYGTAKLGEVARYVVGADIDERSVAEGAACYESADFVVADAGDLPFSDSTFDIVTCFEVIEHVVRPELVIAEIARVTRTDGLAVISTPNAQWGPIKVRVASGTPDHVRELSATEFEDMLNGYFGEVSILGQRWITPSFRQLARWLWIQVAPYYLREVLSPVTNRIRHLLFPDLDPAGLAEAALRDSKHWPAPRPDKRARPVTLFACCQTGPKNGLSLSTEPCNSVDNRI